MGYFVKRQFKATALLCLMVGAMQACPTAAQGPQTGAQTLEGYADAFTYYRPLSVPTPKSPPAKSGPPQAKPEPKKEQAVDFDWLKENYAKLEKRAFNNPDDKDVVRAYAYTRRILVDKAQRFDDAVYETVRTDPFLNEFNRLPTFWTQGAKSILNIEQKARTKAVKELSDIGGLLVFVDGQCRFCDHQVAVLKTMRSINQIQFLAISTDGTAPAQAKGEAIQRDNGLFRKLKLQLTPSVVYVPRPKAYDAKTAADPNEYFVVAQGFYGVAELEKMLAYSAFKSGKYLSAESRRDLNIWNTGVASNADLQTLRLDPDKPGDFKNKIEPLLRKQYPPPNTGGVNE